MKSLRWRPTDVSQAAFGTAPSRIMSIAGPSARSKKRSPVLSVGKPRFIYRYALRIPWARLRMLNRRAFYWAVRLTAEFELFFRVFPKQTNGFAFIVLKPQVPQQCSRGCSRAVAKSAWIGNGSLDTTRLTGWTQPTDCIVCPQARPAKGSPGKSHVAMSGPCTRVDERAARHAGVKSQFYTEFTSFPLTVLIKALKVAKFTAWP